MTSTKYERPRDRPRDRASWDKCYNDGDMPWDSGRADLHLAEVVDTHGIKPGRALEVGCGTGTNLIWLANQGFDVTGLDLAPTAIAQAEAKMAAAGVRGRLVAADFLRDEIPLGPFEFVYDRGCFHVFDSAAERARFASSIQRLLGADGLWHSLLGSTDGPPREAGPPRRSAAEIAEAVEPVCEILELRATLFDTDRHSQARAWVLVAKRREQNTAP